MKSIYVLGVATLLYMTSPAVHGLERECGADGREKEDCKALEKGVNPKLKMEKSKNKCNQSWSFTPATGYFHVRNSCWGIFSVEAGVGNGAGTDSTIKIVPWAADVMPINPALSNGVADYFGGSSISLEPVVSLSQPQSPPGWAVGSFTAFDERLKKQVLLDIRSNGTVQLRDADGQTISKGAFRGGKIDWALGHQSEVVKAQDVLPAGTSTFVFR